MLLGEHAVLHGFGAVVCAVDKRIKVTLTPRQDHSIVIHSALGEYQTSLDRLEVERPFRFVLASIKLFADQLPSGFLITIDSEFSDEVGLGSSAAVTVATLGALHQWLFGSLDRDALFDAGVSVIRSVQGSGSGCDVAASVYGGVIYYEPVAAVLEKLDIVPEISLVYSGYKMPTVEVIKFVHERANQQPEKFNEIYRKIGECVRQGVLALRAQDWKKLGLILNENYKLQDELGVNDEVLQHIVDRLLSCPEILGAKISGSGLGDCAVALGKVPRNTFVSQGLQQIDVVVSPLGIIRQS